MHDVISGEVSEKAFAILMVSEDDLRGKDFEQFKLHLLHDLVFFQGRFGLSRAAVAVEGGSESLSQVMCRHRIDYPTGKIKKIFWELLEIIHQEFVGMKTKPEQ